MLSEWWLGPEQWTPPTNVLFTSPTTAALNCTRPVIMSGISGSTQAVGALGAPPRGSLYFKDLFAELTSCRQHPLGARHRRLQLRWWPPPDLSPAPPRGPAINVSNSGGGRCWTCRQHPQGARHRHLQLWWWALLDLPTAPPKGARHRRFAKLGTCRQNFPSDTYQGGHRGKHCHYKQATWRKNGGKSLAKKIRSLWCQEPGSHNTITEEVQINKQRYDIINYWNNRKRRKSCSRAEGLRVLRLTLEPLCYRVGRFLNAVLGILRRPFDEPLHRRLKGDAGVTAPEAHQHVVSHRLC
jgi:hypothetical protein